MHEIGANSTTVDATGFLGGFAGQSLQIGLFQRFEQAERIKSRFQVAPAAEGVENAFALFVVGWFREATCGGFLGRLRRLRGALFFQRCTVCHKSSSMNLLFCHRSSRLAYRCAERFSDII